MVRVFEAEGSTPNVPDWEQLPGAASGVMEDQAKQASVAPKSKSGPGAKAKGISEAISQLWPNQIPKGLSAKDRNKAIIDRIRQNGGSIPNSPERAIQQYCELGNRNSCDIVVVATCRVVVATCRKTSEALTLISRPSR